ncbi:hypothetical protein BX283_7531 [Streptomyces sp. TLI_146]|nr:hypothetical protein BX283_7531 [Streptomyces sp. TLI_146]
MRLGTDPTAELLYRDNKFAVRDEATVLVTAINERL